MINLISKWDKIRQYFIMCNFNTDITRKEYLKTMYKKHKIKPITCDNCRCILMTAGYLSRAIRGVYRKSNEIPYHLTYTEARIEAYGK